MSLVSNATSTSIDQSGQPATNGHVKTNGQARKIGSRKTRQQGITTLIEQSITLRTALHDLIHHAGGLVKALNQHRRQSKAVETTLASLRTLKTLGV